MSAAPVERASVEAVFVETYQRTFDDFVGHLRRQGFAVSDRIMESAHERATARATQAARSGGDRSVNLAPCARSGLAWARAKYGY
jgi:hypothetical protein